jgi:hypothetical protein
MALAMVATCCLRAQANGSVVEQGKAPSNPEVAIEARIDKAIEAYEAVRKDSTKLAQRRRLLGWIGEIDHPRVTSYLEKNLARTAKAFVGKYSVEAIEKLSRPDLEPALIAVVKRKDANHAVRVAATIAVTQFGSGACSDLIDLAAETEHVAVRRSVLQGLSQSNSTKVHRDLAKMILDGDHEYRLAMLVDTRFAKGCNHIDKARIKCVKEGNLIVAAKAWRQLAEQGHRRAASLTVDVLERVYGAPTIAAAAELVRGLVIVGEPDFFPAILRFGATRGVSVKQALKSVAGIAGKNEELIAFLVEEGLESEVPGERRAAKILLAKAPASAIAPLVARVRKQLQRNRTKMLDSASGLHELLAKDPTWVNDLLGLASANDLESRMTGLAMLHEMKSPAAISVAQRYIKHRAWELRSLAFRYLAECREVTSIPLLIGRYGKEEGRLENELSRALFVHTGTRCWTRAAWTSWWRENREGFVLPHPESVKSGGGSGAGKTVSYHGIPLVSARIAFLIDHSGSMVARISTNQKRNRLDEAKEQLRKVVTELPKTHKVNLVLFQSVVTSVWKELRRLNGANRRVLLEAIDDVRLAGGTNTYSALMAAFDDPEVDTIYLLTDGLPTAGSIVDTDEILDAVMRENRIRQVVIHGISIGMDSRLLKELAELTGGEFKLIR